MHCPIASDHIVPKHVWSVHTKHNLWPWGRRGRSQHVGNSGQGMEEGAQSPRGRGLTEGRWGPRTPLYRRLLPRIQGAEGGGNGGSQNVWARPRARPGCLALAEQGAAALLSLDKHRQYRPQLRAVPRACSGSFLCDGSRQTQVCHTWLLGRRAASGCLGESKGLPSPFL